MYGILVSAFFQVLKFLVSSVLVKFVAFFGLYFIVTGFMSIVSDMLPSATSLSPALGSISSDIWFFLDLFAFSVGLPMILAAQVTAFIIRRLPVIG